MWTTTYRSRCEQRIVRWRIVLSRTRRKIDSVLHCLWWKSRVIPFIAIMINWNVRKKNYRLTKYKRLDEDQYELKDLIEKQEEVELEHEEKLEGDLKV